MSGLGFVDAFLVADVVGFYRLQPSSSTIVLISPAFSDDLDISEGDEIAVIKSIDFDMDEAYINGVYDSCKGVIMPSTGGYSIDLACNTQQGANQCTPKKWYEFMGDANSAFVPFGINYTYGRPERAFRAETKLCSEAYPVNMLSVV